MRESAERPGATAPERHDFERLAHLARQQKLARLARGACARRRIARLGDERLDARAEQKRGLGGEAQHPEPGGVRRLGHPGEIHPGSDVLHADMAEGIVAREAPADARLAAAYEAMRRGLPRPLPEGYRSELCLRVEPWVRGVAEFLERGALLVLDYGLPRAHYYHPERAQGTLRCHFRQRVHDDPLVRVGVQDITAWVDFTRVAEAADTAGLEVLGFATQAAFLLGTGIEALVAAPPDPAERARAASEARRLLLPGEMGEAFKVMALGRELRGPLGGFAHQDLRASL